MTREGADVDRLASHIAKQRLERFDDERFDDGAASDLIAVWDRSVFNDRCAFAIGALSTNGIQLLDRTELPATSRHRMLAALARHGIRSAAMCTGSDLVWLLDDDGGAVWNARRKLIGGSSSELHTADGRLPRELIVAIAVDESAGMCRVAGELPDGSRRSVVVGPSGPWATEFGYDLALWCGVPLDDRYRGATVDPQLAHRLRELAERVTAVAVGVVELHLPRDHYTLTLRSGVFGGGERYVELAVTHAGQVTSAWLTTAATADELVAALRWPPTVDRAARIVRALAEPATLESADDRAR